MIERSRQTGSGVSLRAKTNTNLTNYTNYQGTMSDWDNKGSISMSFDIKADEKAVDFFNRTMKELKDFEKAINERMIQLFDENIGVGGEKADEAYKQVLKVFMLGYGHGWNDRKELIDKMKELCQEKN
jgi:hypothetical protein